MSISDFEVVAERELVLLANDTGEKKRIVVKIGRPYWHEGGLGAVCPIGIVGLLEPKTDIRGVDLLHALEMALLFVQSFLSNRTKANTILWPSGEEYRRSVAITDSSGSEWNKDSGSE